MSEERVTSSASRCGIQASVAVEADPVAAVARLEEPNLAAAARESRYLSDLADRTAARAALALGDLSRCVELGLRLASSPSTLIVGHAARLLSAAALLGHDVATADAATAIADQRLRTVAGTQGAADLATHRRALLAGGEVRVDPDLLPQNLDPHDPLAASSLFLLCREAIDAGAAELGRRDRAAPSAGVAAGPGGVGRDRGRGDI